MRTIFISDLHLGTPGCQATALLDFLKAHPSDNLYLVGDIIDGWQMRRKCAANAPQMVLVAGTQRCGAKAV